AVPSRVAAVLGDASLTFGELDRLANRTVRALGEVEPTLGVHPGARVVTWAGTTLDVLPVFAGLAKAGAVFAPVNGGLQPHEAVAMASAARPHLLVVDAEHEHAAAAVAAELGVPAVSAAGIAGGPVAGPAARGVPRLTDLAAGRGGADLDTDVRVADHT